MDESRDQQAAPARADVPRPVPPLYPPALPGGKAPRPRGRRRVVIWLLVLLALAMLGLFAWRLAGPARPAGGSHARNGADGPQPVGLAKIGSGDMHVTLTGLGTVTPLATITVQSQISGVLMSVGFREGQLVHAGDFLAQIDPRPYQVALEQAQGAYAHDSGLLAQAKSDLARYVSLNRQDSIAKQQVADQGFLVQQDQGLVMQDQALIDSARLNLAYCRITAPVTGRVGLRLVDPGNYVQAASATGLVVITQMTPVSVVFVLPEDDIPAIAKEMGSTHALPVGAYDRTNSVRIAQGTLGAVDNTVDTTTGTVKLRAEFANADLALFANQFVNARLLLRTLHDVVQAPEAAVQHGAPGAFVYLVKPGNTVGVQVVGTGLTDGDTVQILSGVKPGDQVVVDGADRLKDGARIRAQPDTTAGGAAPPDGSGASPDKQPDDQSQAPANKHHRRRAQQSGQ